MAATAIALGSVGNVKLAVVAVGMGAAFGMILVGQMRARRREESQRG